MKKKEHLTPALSPLVPRAEREKAPQTIPYRLDLAGGWLDQPFVSKLCAGPVITVCLEPLTPALSRGEREKGAAAEYAERSGLSTSTRKRALELWPDGFPDNVPKEKIAKALFAYENPPGTKMFSGSQDSIGIVYPGVNRLQYDGDFWPERISGYQSAAFCQWLERLLWLIPLGPRRKRYDPMAGCRVTKADAARLATSAEQCWQAICDMECDAFGNAVTASFGDQLRMFPAMMDIRARRAIARLPFNVLGYKLAGAGGGGYLVVVSKHSPGSDALRVKIRRA